MFLNPFIADHEHAYVKCVDANNHMTFSLNDSIKGVLFTNDSSVL